MNKLIIEMRKVMAFGTFDLLHPGHIDFLKQAKSMGNYLIVVVSRDDSAFSAKGMKPINSQSQRAELVSSIKFVDEVSKGKKNHLKIIQEIQPEVIALGYDQKISVKKLKQELNSLGLNPEIKRCRAFKSHKFKSSKIRKKIIKECGK
ncbi:MAG: adenylyltransferase/cytidyltransferase family protein [Candidatus Diapherotrites archaeon]